MSDEVEKIARQIARGDRSITTAKAYLRALGATEDAPEDPWIGTIKVTDSGELHDFFERNKPKRGKPDEREFRASLLDEAWDGDRWQHNILEDLDKIAVIVPFSESSEVRIMPVGEPFHESADDTLTGEDFYTYELGLLPVRLGSIVVEAREGAWILRATVPPPGGPTIVPISVVFSDGARNEHFQCSGEWHFRAAGGATGPDEIQIEHDCSDSAEAAVTGALERRLIERIIAARKHQLSLSKRR